MALCPYLYAEFLQGTVASLRLATEFAYRKPAVNRSAGHTGGHEASYRAGTRRLQKQSLGRAHGREHSANLLDKHGRRLPVVWHLGFRPSVGLLGSPACGQVLPAPRSGIKKERGARPALMRPASMPTVGRIARQTTMRKPPAYRSVGTVAAYP